LAPAIRIALIGQHAVPTPVSWVARLTRGVKPGPVLVLVVAGMASSACGATQTTTVTQTISPPAASATRTGPVATKPHTRPPHAPPPSLPRLGATQHVSARGTTLMVTIRAVIDPLRGSGVDLIAGTKPVAILVAVRNVGPGGYDSSSTGDFSLASAAGQASPAFVPKGICRTPPRDFMNAIAAGEARTGCVAFSIPDGQRPTTVGFAPEGGSSGRRRLWSAR
jgi:hypothetical protein